MKELFIYFYLEELYFMAYYPPNKDTRQEMNRMAIAVLELALYIRLVRYLHASAS